MDTVEHIPVAEGLFQWTGATAQLIGARCSGCGTHYFPNVLSCRNPHCPAKEVEQVQLSRRGRLYSYTLQAYRPPPLFRMEPWSPYVIGVVKLPEGLRIMGMLTDTPLADVHIDMEVELTVEPLYRDQKGRDVLTYKFRPVRTGSCAP